MTRVQQRGVAPEYGDGGTLQEHPLNRTAPSSLQEGLHGRNRRAHGVQRRGPAVEILADAGYQRLGSQTGGRVVTPPHRKFKKNAPDWYEEMHERQRKAHSSRVSGSSTASRT